MPATTSYMDTVSITGPSSACLAVRRLYNRFLCNPPLPDETAVLAHESAILQQTLSLEREQTAEEQGERPQVEHQHRHDEQCERNHERMHILIVIQDLMPPTGRNDCDMAKTTGLKMKVISSGIRGLLPDQADEWGPVGEAGRNLPEQVGIHNERPHHAKEHMIKHRPTTKRNHQPPNSNQALPALARAGPDQLGQMAGITFDCHEEQCGGRHSGPHRPGIAQNVQRPARSERNRGLASSVTSPELTK